MGFGDFRPGIAHVRVDYRFTGKVLIAFFPLGLGKGSLFACGSFLAFETTLAMEMLLLCLRSVMNFRNLN